MHILIHFTRKYNQIPNTVIKLQDDIKNELGSNIKRTNLSYVQIITSPLFVLYCFI